jgi:hypothetical protein
VFRPGTCLWQIYHEMLVLDVDSWWFVSFDPRATDPAWRYFETLVRREAERMDRMTTTINKFLEAYSAGREFGPEARTAKRYSEMFN